MTPLDEALGLVAAHAGRQPIESVPLGLARGLVLAEAAISDIDSPPFAKALMDGIACRAADLPGGRGTLRLAGEIRAGAAPGAACAAGEAWGIMTGAAIPEGADAVVARERCVFADGSVSCDDAGLRPGQHILPRAAELRAGAEILPTGRRLGPAELGVLATIGVAMPAVYRRPRVAVLATGDEIVPPEATPGPGQIRNSNATTLAALALQAGAEARILPAARDDADELRQRIAETDDADVLLLSGGVSAGKADLAPAALAAAGATQVFHKVAFKPGMPLWFGVRGRTAVFGLPGNPVSVLACFAVFVATALRVRQRWPDPMPRLRMLPLAAPLDYLADRPTYHPASVAWPADGSPTIRLLPWQGSADLLSAAAANALLALPPGRTEMRVGELVSFLPLGWELP